MIRMIAGKKITNGYLYSLLHTLMVGTFLVFYIYMHICMYERLSTRARLSDYFTLA